MKKIFRKDKFIKVMLYNTIRTDNYDFNRAAAMAIGPDGWATKCDGKEVIDGYIGDYPIVDNWCEEVEEDEN